MAQYIHEQTSLLWYIHLMLLQGRYCKSTNFGGYLIWRLPVYALYDGRHLAYVCWRHKY